MREYEGGVGPLAPDIIEACVSSNGFVLELGVFTGSGSTAMIQDGLVQHERPLHIGVDWQDIIEPIYRPSVSWWHLVLGDTRKEETLHKVLVASEERRPGVIFIDTDHNYAQMKAELELWGRMAAEDTVWLFHDTWMFGPHNVDMVRAITEYADANGWVYEDYRRDSHGLGRMRR